MKSIATRDVFVCHAREDKVHVVAPLVARLEESGFLVWYDEAEIRWGESVVEKVNWGLQNSRYVIVVLSANFSRKNWPARELNAALNIEASGGEVKVLPLLVGDKEAIQEVIAKYPMLSDKRLLHWDALTHQELIYEFVRLAGSSRHRQLASLQSPALSGAVEATPLRVSVLGKVISAQKTNVVCGNVISAIRQTVGSDASQTKTRARGDQLDLFVSLVRSIASQNCNNSLRTFVEVDWSVASDADSVRIFSEVLRFSDVDVATVTLLVPEVMLVELVQGHVGFSGNLHGMNLGISDFGIGYTSLAYLTGLPVTALITAEIFSRSIPEPDSPDMVILRTIGSLGKSLGLETCMPIDVAHVDTSWVHGLEFDFFLTPN